MSTNIKDKLKNVNNKIYQVVSNNGKIEKRYIASGKASTHIVTLRFEMLGYKIFFMQYVVRDYEVLNNNYLRMVGLHFIDGNRTVHSLDIVNDNGTDNIELHLYSYDINGKLISNKTIEKIDKLPCNDKVVSYLLSKLSHAKVRWIYEDKDESRNKDRNKDKSENKGKNKSENKGKNKNKNKENP